MLGPSIYLELHSRTAHYVDNYPRVGCLLVDKVAWSKQMRVFSPKPFIWYQTFAKIVQFQRHIPGTDIATYSDHKANECVLDGTAMFLALAFLSTIKHGQGLQGLGLEFPSITHKDKKAKFSDLSRFLSMKMIFI